MRGPGATATQRRRRIAVFVVSLLAALLALEVAARAAERVGDDALRWYDASTQLRVEQMDEIGQTDVVFAGTSMAWQGLVPEVWAEHDTLGRTAFNVGMAGGVPAVMEPWLLEVVQPRLQPDLVVWGLSTMDLSASYGADNLERYYDALDSRRGLLADIEQGVARFSALVRYRNVLRDPSEWWTDRGLAEAAAVLGAGGERRDFAEDTSNRRGRQVAARVAGFALDPADIASIDRTVTKLQEAGTEVVLVELPVPQRYVDLHPNGVLDVIKNRRALERLGDLLGVPVLNAMGGFTDSDFVDFTHLDEEGAARLTSTVATQLTSRPPPPTISAAITSELIETANELAAVSDEVRSAMTRTKSLPESSELWSSSIEYGHTRDLYAHAAAGRRFHTLFAGSSMVYADLDPRVYESETGHSAYNAGLPSAGPEEVTLYLNDVALDTAQPQRVVIGIAPRDFRSAGRGRGQSCVVTPDAYLRAKATRSETFEEAGWFQGSFWSELLLGNPVEHEPVRRFQFDTKYRENFSLLGDRIDYPKKNRRQLRAEAEMLRDRIESYEFCQERVDALAELVSELKARGIEVIVVAMPLSSFRVNPLPGGRIQMQAIIATAGRAVADAGADHFIDFSELFEDSDFYDYTHTDEKAAKRLTRRLAAALGEIPADSST